MKSIQIAVSEFSIPAPRAGSIDTYSGYGPLPNVGSQLHLEVQAQRMEEHPGYTAERWVSHAFETGPLKVTVSGRMDGFLFGVPALIEEIKSAYNLEGLKAALSEGSDHPYLRQLRTYGYIHFLQTGHTPHLNLILVCARTRKTEIFPVPLDPEEYTRWLSVRLSEIEAEQKDFERLHERRKKESGQFVFPFEQPRSGQKELIEKVEKQLGHDTRMMIQAPTGLGKTIGIMFPSLREAYARGQKLVYVTAKNSQHEVAEEAAKRLQEKGVKVRALTLHAKTKMCLKDEPQCNPQYCEFAKNYYTKVTQNDLPAKLAKKKNLSAAAFKKMGRTFEVCPFELQLEAVGRADVVIADYNYVFSPHNSRARLLQNGYGCKTAPNLVIDEAHNLPARANDYFSAQLDTSELRELFQRASYVAGDTADQLATVREALTSVLARYAQNQPLRVALQLQDFDELYSSAMRLLANYLAQGGALQLKDPVLKICNLISTFYQMAAEMNENFIATWTPKADGGSLGILCCDASKWLSESYEHFENVVAFSATLKPFDYYTRLMGFDAETLVTAEFLSPFPMEKRKLMIIPQISTKARDRANNYTRIAETIARISSLKEGNYFAFFPSFDFMNQVARLVNLPGYRILVQSREMSRSAIGEVLDRLRETHTPTLVFAVQGSVFAEGVDYPGDMLIGAFIVGPALPNFDFEREQLRDFYERKYGEGFDYAYTYPAMSRVIQSAGRVIRSPNDRGLIVLMDRRFLDESYSKAMPKDWCPTGPSDLVSESILNDVKHFWENHGAE